jgi:hypothetical protein
MGNNIERMDCEDFETIVKAEKAAKGL